jgi:hypothetical protein
MNETTFSTPDLSLALCNGVKIPSYSINNLSPSSPLLAVEKAKHFEMSEEK